VRFISFIFVLAIGVFGGEPLRVTVSRVPVQAPLFLAKAEGLFEKASLKVEFREYEVGKIALDDMIAGRVDVAFSAVTPLVNRCLAGNDFRIIANVASSTSMLALVGRQDLGITNVADIRGKRIGLTPGTSAEFFFETLRVLNRVPKAGLTITPRNVQGLIDGLQDGSLDAIAIWEPHIETLRTSLTNRLSVFYGDGLYTFAWNMTALPEMISKRRADLERFMDVLFEASAEIESDPEKAAAELISQLGPQGREMTIGLKENRFRPQLGQELLVEMEGEARWINNRELRTNATPNFLRWFDTSILKKAHASAVTLIQ
jgi:NitT/TauT family transport system substrate-binding protein